MASDLCTICTAATAEVAEQALDAFEKKWQARFPSIQAQLRKVTSNRGAFPNPEAVRKVLYLAIERISKRWKQPIKDWVAALNHFSVVFEGRIPE